MTDMTSPEARKHLALLEHATRGVRLSAAERAALAKVAELDTDTVVAIAKVLNRARASVPVLQRETSLARPAPDHRVEPQGDDFAAAARNAARN
jgi:hypothetical protein